MESSSAYENISIKEEEFLEMTNENKNKKKMIKFVCISDTHTKTSMLQLPKGDVLIHAGDFTFSGKNYEIEGFNKFLKKQDFKYKIIIAGNHEISFDQDFYDNKMYPSDKNDKNTPTPEKAKAMLEDCIYLENSSVELFGYKIYGSPVTPEFENWAFMKNRGEDIKKTWDEIPTDTDILITHGPPHNILDMCYDKVSAGCEELILQIQQRIKPLYHIFGHIHESNGMVKINETTYINAAICNLHYKPNNKYYTFELEDRSG